MDKTLFLRRFGVRVRQARIAKKMSQTTLADIIGYRGGRAAICQIEQGGVEVPVTKIISIAEALGVAPSTLLFGEPTSISGELARVIDLFSVLNNDGRDKLIEQAELLSSSPKYSQN